MSEEFRLTFDDAGDFVAIHKAEAWLRERGYSVGSMQADAPMGILHGDYGIAKWRNLTPKHRAQLDGWIEGEDKRNGPVTIVLRRTPHESPAAPAADRAPNMYVQPTTVAHHRDAALFTGKDPAPMQAPRIEIAVGDQVTYPAAGGGYLESTHEGMGGRLVGEVRLAAWFWDDENDCYTTENTGRPAVLPIRAADLTRKGA